jgi:TonB-dependent SusC/RagA subfamily outer membrane receptor
MEMIQKSESFVYNYEEKLLDMTVENDSIAVMWKENGIRLNAHGEVWGVDAFDNRTKLYEGDLPVKIPLNPFYTNYETESEKVKVGLHLKDTPDLLNCYSHRSKDQVEIKVNNPRNIPFYYDIFKQNTRLENGYTHALDYSNSDISDVDYYIFINYIWAGEVKSVSYRVSKQSNTLNIEVTQPQMVFPGQTTDIEVQVTDFNGQPVKNVDLTAFALTKKFNYKLEDIPEFKTKTYYKNQINNFNLETLNQKELDDEVLNYQFWNTKARLDSIPYYQFSYPGKEIYKFEYDAQDSITQFAPYVFKKGIQQKVHVVFVDNKPVYFDWNTNYNPYSFRISPGYHSIRMRTSQSEIFMDSMYFNAGKKLIFSINDTLNLPKINRWDMNSKWTDVEKNMLYRYIFPYQMNTLKQTVLLKNGENYFWLNNVNNVGNSYNTNYNVKNWTGPVSGVVDYTVKGSYVNTFYHEPNFEYEVFSSLIKMREKNDYPTYYSDLNTNLNWHDQVLTLKSIEQFEQSQLNIKRQSTTRFNNPNNTKLGNGLLVTSLVFNDSNNLNNPLNVILTQPNDPLFFRIYNGINNVFHDLKPGVYQLTILFADQFYTQFEPIVVKPFGTNYYEFTVPDTLIKDEFSNRFNELIENNVNNNVDYNRPQTEVMEYQNLYFDFRNSMNGSNLVQGIVQDESGPLPGVNVIIKGTKIGTETDFDGHYSILVNLGQVLEFSYIGMSTVEKIVYGSQVSHVNMSEDSNALDEVVIVGYGTTTKKSYLGYASSVTVSNNMVSFLNGEVAGVSITEASGIPGSTQSIRIRGYESVNGEFEKKALVVINGVPYFGDLSDIDLSFITEIKIIKDASAAALYGSRAANGVIIINTGQKNLKNLLPPENPVFEEGFMEATMQQNSIRSRFSDEAYWQPRLTTDKYGKAKFSVTYPDDVTSWDAHFIAIDRKKTGVKSTQVKALKPVLAQLFTPRFLLKGDSTIAIGKSINYIPDSIQITRQMEFNDKQIFKKESFLKEILIDSLPFIAEKDSIKIKYFLSKNDGYRDGELRDIPVFPVGLEKTYGHFYTMDRDTILHPKMNPAYGEAKLYLRADILDVLKEELQSVKYYKFDCNEQMASKLKAYLAEQHIQMHLGANFKHEAEVKKLIQKLNKNQNSFMLWGWWNVSETTPWISLHVLEALIEAEQLNYKVNIKKDLITQSLIWMFANTKDFDTQIRILKSVILMRAKADYEGFYKELEKHNLTDISDQLQMLEISQLIGKPIDIQMIKKHQETTLFGNIYISKPQKNVKIFTNEIQNTLLAYRILQRDSVLRKSEAETLRKMRNYFLEKRNTGKWLNTYESVQIIETILPDLLGKETHVKAPEVHIKGILDQKITEFPFEIELNPDASLEITKTGTSPVYMSISQNYWESNPMPFSADFEIKTHFSNNVDFLEAGKEVTLIATVQVNKDAEYVMISIPIPAGCSYADSNMKGYQESP